MKLHSRGRTPVPHRQVREAAKHPPLPRLQHGQQVREPVADAVVAAGLELVLAGEVLQLDTADLGLGLLLELSKEPLLLRESEDLGPEVLEHSARLGEQHGGRLEGWCVARSGAPSRGFAGGSAAPPQRTARVDYRRPSW
jgi:hypothetical protein